MTDQNNEKRYRYAIDPQGESTSNKVLRLTGAGKRVLELGCGPGSMTEHLTKQQHCTVTAIEVDPELAKYAEPFCEHLIIGNLETMDLAATFNDQQFDVIIAADVLEHLNNPWQCLRSLHSLFSDNGYLVTSIPNIGHNAIITQLLAGRFPYGEQGLLDRTHLRFFARHDVEDLLLSTGYVPSIWMRNRVSESQSEFGYRWLTLDPALQQALSKVADGQTYQFIVKAYPSTNTGWQAKMHAELTDANEKWLQTKNELAATKESLSEHQLAFSEAQATITKKDGDLTKKDATLAEQQQTITTLTAELSETRLAFSEAKEIIERFQHEKEALAQKLAQHSSPPPPPLSRRVVNRLRRLLN